MIQNSKSPTGSKTAASARKKSTAVHKTRTQHQSPQAILQRAQMQPSSLTSQDIIQLQRTIGNRAVIQLLSNSRTNPTESIRSEIVQRKPKEATVLKKGGAALHKTKVKNGVTQVRRGGFFGTGKVLTIPRYEILTVDHEQSIGNYVKGDYRGYTGYINKANIHLRYATDVDESIAFARRVLDGYLKTHTVQQHIKNDKDYKESVGQGMKSLLSALKNVQYEQHEVTNSETGESSQRRRIVDPATMPNYWQEKGRNLLDEQTNHNLSAIRQGIAKKIPMTCDQSTAIIIARLTSEPQFCTSLTVIRQGDPKQHGHWYVLANRHPDNDNPQYGDQLMDGEFIIDIWGALRLKEGNRKINTVVYDKGNNHLFNASVVNESVNAAKYAQQNRLKTMVEYPA